MSKIEIYTIVLLSLRAIAWGYFVGSKDEYKSISNGERSVNLLIGTLGILPLIGRVFNWW